jgi:branched-chain amino acid transport system substrate-binding protein
LWDWGSMHNRVLLALTALAALVTAPAASAPAAPYVIPVILPLTGPAANTGTLAATTLHIFENYANARGGLRGAPIHFDIHDDGSQPATAVQLLSAAMAQHPAVVLGPTPTQTCNALAALVEKTGPVLYCSTPGTLPPRGSYVFCAAMALPQFDRGIIRYMRLRGYKRLAIISSTDGSGQANDAATREVLALPESKDLKVVTWEHMNPTDINANAQALHIKASGAQGIIAWVSGPTFGTVLRSLRDVGVDLPLTPNGANVNPDELTQFNDFLPTEMPLAGFPFMAPDQVQRTPLRGPVNDMIAAYRAAGEKISAGGVGYAWDSASIVLAGLRKIGPGATAEQLRDYILSLRNFAGIDGVYDFTALPDQHGLSDTNVVMVAWDGKTKDWTPLSKMGSVPLK